jgi:hypothetical protein
VITYKTLSLEEAELMLDAAQKKAAEMGVSEVRASRTAPVTRSPSAASTAAR